MKQFHRRYMGLASFSLFLCCVSYLGLYGMCGWCDESSKIIKHKKFWKLPRGFWYPFYKSWNCVCWLLPHHRKQISFYCFSPLIALHWYERALNKFSYYSLPHYNFFIYYVHALRHRTASVATLLLNTKWKMKHRSVNLMRHALISINLSIFTSNICCEKKILTRFWVKLKEKNFEESCNFLTGINKHDFSSVLQGLLTCLFLKAVKIKCLLSSVSIMEFQFIVGSPLKFKISKAFHIHARIIPFHTLMRVRNVFSVHGKKWMIKKIIWEQKRLSKLLVYTHTKREKDFIF